MNTLKNQLLDQANINSLHRYTQTKRWRKDESRNRNLFNMEIVETIEELNEKQDKYENNSQILLTTHK